MTLRLLVPDGPATKQRRHAAHPVWPELTEEQADIQRGGLGPDDRIVRRVRVLHDLYSGIYHTHRQTHRHTDTHTHTHTQTWSRCASFFHAFPP